MAFDEDIGQGALTNDKILLDSQGRKVLIQYGAHFFELRLVLSVKIGNHEDFRTIWDSNLYNVKFIKAQEVE